MLHRLFETIRGINPSTGFEVYLRNLQRTGATVMPTVEEARRDYRAIFRSEPLFLG